MDHKRRESTRHSHSRIQKGSQTKWAQKMETEKRMEILTNERRGTDKQTNKKHTEFPERSIFREYGSERDRECVLFYFKSNFSHCVHSNLRMFTDSTIHQMHFIQSMKIQFIYGNGGYLLIYILLGIEVMLWPQGIEGKEKVVETQTASHSPTHSGTTIMNVYILCTTKQKGHFITWSMNMIMAMHCKKRGNRKIHTHYFWIGSNTHYFWIFLISINIRQTEGHWQHDAL